jgi:hypothetical protein
MVAPLAWPQVVDRMLETIYDELDLIDVIGDRAAR